MRILKKKIWNKQRSYKIYIMDCEARLSIRCYYFWEGFFFGGGVGVGTYSSDNVALLFKTGSFPDLGLSK